MLAPDVHRGQPPPHAHDGPAICAARGTSSIVGAARRGVLVGAGARFVALSSVRAGFVTSLRFTCHGIG
jgi:hypothetical protein